MVYQYQTPCGHLLYKGKDKHQNQLLIEYSLPIDIWFHAADISSAHVYLRLQPQQTWDTIPQQVIDFAIQLTKQNSIQGSKKSNIDVVYTPARNLKKTQDMDIGAVGYKDDKMVKRVKHVGKDKMVLKMIEKTEEWVERDYKGEMEEWENKQAKEKFMQKKEEEKKKKNEEEERRKEKERLDYGLMDVQEYKSSNKEFNEEEDFM